MKIVILGAGNMGAWFTGELAKGNDVAVYDTDLEKSSKTANEYKTTLLEEIKQIENHKPDMLINAVGLHNTIDAFRSIESFVGKQCILADIASIKGKIPDYYKYSGFRSVSVHPMFGPTFANMKRFKGENAVIIKESDPEGTDFFRKFFLDLGLRVFEYSADEHDRMMAYSLSLPFVSTMVFSACMKETAVPGSTFAKHMTIAKGLLSEDDRLLTEIIFNEHTLNQLNAVTSRLELLKHIIMGKDYDEAKRFFDRLRLNLGDN